MSRSPEEESQQPSRDAAYWAQPVNKLSVSDVPEGAVNLVEGRQLLGPLQGFGKMWQKTYRIQLANGVVTPAEVISTWKQEFARFWPRGNKFYAPLTGIQPGEVALVSIAAGPVKLSTGVMVLYADPESFTLMTPQGHMFAGWITFSSFEEEACCVAQAQVLMRAQDPISEIGLTLGGHSQENRFWQQTLKILAANWGRRRRSPDGGGLCRPAPPLVAGEERLAQSRDPLTAAYPDDARPLADQSPAESAARMLQSRRGYLSSRPWASGFAECCISPNA